MEKRPRKISVRRIALLGVALSCLELTSGLAFAQNGTVPNAGRNSVPPAPAPSTSAPQPKLNPTGRAIELEVPLREYGPLGQVHMTLTADDRVLISANDLLNALSREIKPEELDRLRKLADAHGLIDIKALAPLGYVITYDPSAIELSIATPLSAHSRGVISLGYGNDYQTVQPDKSAPLGVYLNYRVGETYLIAGPNKGQTDFQGDLEFSGRLADTFAFENFATMDQLNSPFLTRTASRAIYDMPGPALRLTAGDLDTETAGFQADPQIAGINISHLIDTFYPFAATSGLSSRTMVLTRASDVQLMVNNVPVSEIHLNPGTYDLRDLPLTQGANRVQAVITDDTGNRIVQNYNLFSAATLLNPGLDEYTFSAGILGPIGDRGDPDYTGEWAMSGFYRRGITDSFTGGFDLQADRTGQMLGLDGVFGTSFGLFQVNLSGNHSQNDDMGGAARIEYNYTENTTTEYFSRTYDLSVEYDSPKFGSIQDLNPISTQSFIFSGDLTQPIRQDLFLQFSGNYALSRVHGDNTGTVSAYLVYQAPYDTTIGLGATYIWAPNLPGQPDLTGRGFSLALTLTHQFDPSTLADVQANRFQQRANITHSPSDPINDYYYSGDVSRSFVSGTTGTGTAGYETNRGDISANYSATLNNSGTVESQQTGVFFDGSVAMADGHIGLGRHITDSFAVISPDDSLGDRSVQIDSRFANQVVAESGPLGPAVLPTSSYTRQLIPYDVQDLPPGYDLGTGNFDVYPWLHSGFALKVGSPYNVTVLGYMLDNDGKPLSLVTGEAVSLDDKNAPHQEVITNRAGRFAAQGLSPGRWRITMSGEKPLVYDITISKKQGMLAKFDTLKPITAQ